jgi:hypothetical protein
VTVDTKAAEIAAEFAGEGSDRSNLELAILRHMEHHIALEREACAQLAEQPLVVTKADAASGRTVNQLIADRIRKR